MLFGASRSRTACFHPSRSHFCLKAMPAGEWRAMPSKNVASSCVLCSPELSYAYDASDKHYIVSIQYIVSIFNSNRKYKYTTVNRCSYTWFPLNTISHSYLIDEPLVEEQLTHGNGRDALCERIRRRLELRVGNALTYEANSMGFPPVDRVTCTPTNKKIAFSNKLEKMAPLVSD